MEPSNTTSDATEVIDFNGVEKVYLNGTRGLHPTTFTLHEGEFISLMGPSGCGKSTILKLVAGLTEPSSGALTLPKQVAVVFQSGALFPWLTALDNVSFGLRMQGTPNTEAAIQAREKLELLKLGNFAESYPRELSGGQRQRVGIARALAVKPEVLLLDEPFSALDETTRFDLYADILDIWHAHKLSILMVSHQADETAFLAQKVFIMGNNAIQKEIQIDMPYPRDMRSQPFTHKVNDIRAMFPTQTHSTL